MRFRQTDERPPVLGQKKTFLWLAKARPTLETGKTRPSSYPPGPSLGQSLKGENLVAARTSTPAVFSHGPEQQRKNSPRCSGRTCADGDVGSKRSRGPTKQTPALSRSGKGAISLVPINTDAGRCLTSPRPSAHRRCVGGRGGLTPKACKNGLMRHCHGFTLHMDPKASFSRVRMRRRCLAFRDTGLMASR